MNKQNKENHLEPSLWQDDWREQYWRERSEEGRNLPRVPENCERLVDLLSKDIQAALRQMRKTFDQYEEYAMYRRVAATNSPIDLSILEGLRKNLTRLADETDDEFHDMLGGYDYWRWSCCNEPETAKELKKEMEKLAEHGA